MFVMMNFHWWMLSVYPVIVLMEVFNVVEMAFVEVVLMS